MANYDPHTQNGFRKTALTYVKATYLGLVSAFSILFFEFFTMGMVEHILTALWVFAFYSTFDYLLGKSAGAKGTFIGFILSLPILAIMFWIPEALIHSTFKKKYYMVVVPIGALIIGTIGQLIGKSKARP